MFKYKNFPDFMETFEEKSKTAILEGRIADEQYSAICEQVLGLALICGIFDAAIMEMTKIGIDKFETSVIKDALESMNNINYIMNKIINALEGA